MRQSSPKKTKKPRLHAFNKSAGVPGFTKRGTLAWYVVGTRGPRRGPYGTEEQARAQSWGDDVVVEMRV